MLRILSNSIFAVTTLYFVLCVFAPEQAPAHSPGHSMPQAEISGPALGWEGTLGDATMLASKFAGSRNYSVKPLSVAAIGYADWFRASYISVPLIDALALVGVAQTPFGWFSAKPPVRYMRGRSSGGDLKLHGFRTLDGVIKAGGFVGLARSPREIEQVTVRAVNDGSRKALFVDAAVDYRFHAIEMMPGRIGIKLRSASGLYIS